MIELPKADAHILLGDDSEDVYTATTVRSLIAEAVANEREACAKACEGTSATVTTLVAACGTHPEMYEKAIGAELCAAAIRARTKEQRNEA